MSGFLPSRHGLRFANSFPGWPVPFDVPGMPSLSVTHGLCGGMAAAAMDYFADGRDIPETCGVPRQGTALYRYLYARQLATFGRAGRYIAQFVAWMALPDGSRHGTRRRSYDHVRRIRAELDRGNPAVIGLVYARSITRGRVWRNHQALAYDHSLCSDGSVTLRIYDPSFPGRDDLTILGTREVVARTGGGRSVYGLRCTQVTPGLEAKGVRGLFRILCNPVRPPDGL